MEKKIKVSEAISEKAMGAPLFSKREIPRAEKIAEALDGLSIESAQGLLNKMNTYLLQTVYKY